MRCPELLRNQCFIDKFKTRAHGPQEGPSLADALRARRRPVFTTVHDAYVWIHLRTLQPDDRPEVVAAIADVPESGSET